MSGNTSFWPVEPGPRPETSPKLAPLSCEPRSGLRMLDTQSIHNGVVALGLNLESTDIGKCGGKKAASIRDFVGVLVTPWR